MQKDNNKSDLKYDAKYDANQYSIMDKLKTQKSTMQPEMFFEFLVQKLVSDYGCSMQNTKQLATELIQGFKIVREGDYALMELKQPLPVGIEYCDFTEDEKRKWMMESNIVKVQKYFKRVNNIWVYDKDVDSTSFAKKTDLTCKLVDTDITKQYVENIEKLIKNIERQYNKEKERLKLTSQIRKQYKYIHDQYHSILGNTIQSNDAMISPYRSILENIRNDYKYDFYCKQEELYAFKKKYCREPTDEENQYWFYCKESETSIPLMPRFEFELADAFKKGNYPEKLIQLKKNSAVHDGYHYDTHTGFPICEVDFLDQGIESINVVEADDDNINTWESNQVNRMVVEMNDNSLKSKYSYKELGYIAIIQKIADKISIPFHWIELDTMMLCRMFSNEKSFFKDKKTYEMQLEKLKGKQTTDIKKVLTYEEYYYERLLFMIVGCMIIVIQTMSSYAMVSAKKSGNCIPTWDGYPLLNEPDTKGIIHYFSCVLRNMKDKTTFPWKTIKQKEGAVEKHILAMFKEELLNNTNIQELLEKKRNYIETQKTQIEGNSIHHPGIILWERFLPPLKSTDIIHKTDSVQEITKSVNERFSIAIRDGDIAQWKYYGLYFGKSLLFSVSILEMINEVIQTKPKILGNNPPFTMLENACCHELEKPMNPIEYFQIENDRISNYYLNVKKIENVFHQLKKYSTASSLVPDFMRRNQATSHHDAKPNENNPICLYDETLIYRTFIRYFHLNSLTKPIPSFLKPFLESKPILNINSSIEEIIQDLKESENKVELSKFSSILSHVNRYNVLKTHVSLEMTYNLQLLESWEILKTRMEDIQSMDTLYIHLQQHFENEKEMEMEKENSEERLKNIEDEFENQIATMKTKLSSILQKKYYEKLITSFDKNWHDVSPIFMGQLTKNFIYTLSTIIPSFLVDGKKGHENFSQWKLMKQDKDTFKIYLKSKFDNLSSFHDKINDSDYTAFIHHIKNIQPDFKLLFDNISLFYGSFPNTKSSLYKRYFRFCLYYCVSRMFHIRESIYTTIGNDAMDEEDFPLDASIESVDIVNQNINIQKKMMKLLDELFVNRYNMFDKYKYTMNNYDDIQENNYKVRHKEKEIVMRNFTTDNKKQLASEKNLKKLGIGKYYTNISVVQNYGTKRDKMLFDAQNQEYRNGEDEPDDNDDDSNTNDDDDLNGFHDEEEYGDDGENSDDGEDNYDGENSDDNDTNEDGYDIDPELS
jgi:hypothetical protein